MRQHILRQITLASLMTGAALMTGPIFAATTSSAVTATTASHLRGRVTAVDATAKTITITARNSTTPITFLVNGSTKYTVAVTAALSDLKVGETVRVSGQTAGSSLTARMVSVVSAGTTATQGGGGFGGRGQQTIGVIKTLTPNLTITTTDNTTLTVETTDRTRITTSKAGTWADVKVDSFVNATATGPDGSQVATDVQVQTGFGGGGRRGGGNRGGNGGGPGGGA